MNAPVSADDIAAIRREEGGLASLIAALTSRPLATATPPPPQIGSAHTSPQHRPGAWPSGTRPVGPNTCSPDCDCSLNHQPTPPAA